MTENELKYLHEKIAYLESALKAYSNLNILAVKNQNSECQLSKHIGADDISVLEETLTIAKSKPKANRHYGRNQFTKKAAQALSKISLIEQINNQLLISNNPVLIYQDESVYSNETIISQVANDFVIDGKEIQNCKQLYHLICAKAKLNPYSDLSNINPPKKIIVVIENYNEMIQQLSKQEGQYQEWLCHLRNTMENNEPLLFVLLNADLEDDTFMRMGELVSRLIQFYN